MREYKFWDDDYGELERERHSGVYENGKTHIWWIMAYMKKA